MLGYTAWAMPGLCICLIVLHVGQSYEDAGVLNKPGFWIWYGCICKGYAEFWICLIMAPYASVMPEYALVSLNMPEHGWVFMNVPDYAWKCLNKLFWLCQGSRYAAT